MSANLPLLQDRFNEVAAASSLASLSKRLHDLATEPSTKRFVRTRPLAAEAWAEVRELAAGRAAAASKPLPVKRASKPRAVTPSNDAPATTAAA